MLGQFRRALPKKYRCLNHWAVHTVLGASLVACLAIGALVVFNQSGTTAGGDPPARNRDQTPDHEAFSDSLRPSHEQATKATGGKAAGNEKTRVEPPVHAVLLTEDGGRLAGKIVAYDTDGVSLQTPDQSGVKKIRWAQLRAKSAWETFDRLLPPDRAESWFQAGQTLDTLAYADQYAQYAYNRAKQADPALAVRIEQLEQARAEAQRRTKQGASFSNQTVQVRTPVKVRVEDRDGQTVAGQVISYNNTSVKLVKEDGVSVKLDWLQLGPKGSYQVIAQVLEEPTGEAWFNIAYELYMLEGGEPVAERAFRQALQHDPGLKQRINEIQARLPQIKFQAVTSAVMRLAKDSHGWQADEQGRYISSLCEDLQGRIWVGTEGKGLWRFDPNEPDAFKRWAHFSRPNAEDSPLQPAATLTNGTPAENALGDNFAYALACDKLGRVWVGHLNHGVSVFNGESWRNYDVLSGPLGERVFDIAISPDTATSGAGDVWIATDAGIARYHLEKDRWSYITRQEGLPEDQVQCLAFADDGTVYVGTQCHGLAIASPDQNGRYTDWRYVTAPKGFGPGGKYPLPLTATGDGLPTDLINDLHVAADGSVWAATTVGLAYSRNHGYDWQYVRGRDWAQNLRGLYQAPQSVSKAPEQMQLVAADYVTSVGQVTKDKLLLTFRHQGVQIISTDLQTSDKLEQPVGRLKGRRGYFTTALPEADGSAWLGGYGTGLVRLLGQEPAADQALEPKTYAIASGGGALKFPSPVAAPSAREFAALQDQPAPRSLEQRIGSQKVVYLGDDWMTGGDWVGRYGKNYAVLCAAASPLDHRFNTDPGYRAEPIIGPNRAKGRQDSLRRWIAGLHTDERRTLYNPYLGHRRQSSWDDHGEGYPMSFEGPDMWVTVEVPEGTHRVAFYLINPNPHIWWRARSRDWLIEAYRPSTKPGVAPTKLLERTRIRTHYGGVYKQFIIQGPSRHDFKIADNWSYNTTLAGLFIDRVHPAPADQTRLHTCMGSVIYAPPSSDDLLVSDVLSPPSAALLNVRSTRRKLIEDAVSQRISLTPTARASYLALRKAGANTQELERARWGLNLWEPSDRSRFDEVMQRGFQSYQRINTTEAESASAQ